MRHSMGIGGRGIGGGGVGGRGFGGSTGVLALSLGLTLMTGCSTDDTDLLPCPANGIGPAEQRGWEKYDCKQPQICPDLGWLSVFDQPVNGDVREMAVLITNCTKGQAKLVIDKVVLKGDDRCAMSEPEVETKEVLPGLNNAVSIRITWKPKAAGRDDAAIFIHSNAKNYPILEVPVCGTAIASQGDAGFVIPDKGAWTHDAAPPWERCHPVDMINTKCHTDPNP